ALAVSDDGMRIAVTRGALVELRTRKVVDDGFSANPSSWSALPSPVSSIELSPGDGKHALLTDQALHHYIWESSSPDDEPRRLAGGGGGGDATFDAKGENVYLVREGDKSIRRWSLKTEVAGLAANGKTFVRVERLGATHGPPATKLRFESGGHPCGEELELG